MPLTNMREILRDASAKGYAIPAFNVHNLEFVLAVSEAAAEMRSPIIFAATRRAIALSGAERIAQIVYNAVDEYGLIAALHLDHGDDMELANIAVSAGFNSIMLDGSKLSFEENIALLSEGVRVFSSRGIQIEGELGRVGSGGRDDVYTDPNEAEEFIRRTGCDSLAVSIGTSHGAYKFAGDPFLDIKRLNAIRKVVRDLPLVLHGASAVYLDVSARIAQFGGKISGAKGLPDEMLQEAIANGIAKVNIDTDLRMTYMATLRTFLAENAADLDPKRLSAATRPGVKKMAIRKIEVMGSSERQ